MTIRYIIGRSGVGKSYYMHMKIKEVLTNTDKRVYLIVPEQFTLQAERDLITNAELEGIMGAEVLSFTRVGYRVFNEAGGLTKIHINSTGKNMVLRKLMQKIEKHLSIYRKSAKQAGFISSLNKLISELKQQDITPLQLKELLEGIEEKGMIKNKLLDVISIYEGFNQYLEDKYIDAEDNINMLIEKLDYCNIFKGSIIWVDGFHKFTPQTLRLLEKLMTHAEETNFVLTLDQEKNLSEGDLFQLTNQTYERLKRICNNLKLQQETILLKKEHNPIYKNNTLLEHLEEHMYSYPYKRYTDEIKDFKLFAATNRYTEIENVAAEIMALVRDKGLRWRDISVVLGAMGEYQLILKSIFQEYEIPFFLDEKRRIDDHPIIIFILSALDIVHGGFKQKNIFSNFRTGFSDLIRDEWEELENYSLQYGIKGDKWLSQLVDSKEYNMQQINESRHKFITPLLTLVNGLKGTNNIAEITKLLYLYLKELDIEGKLDRWIYHLKEQGLYDYVNENTQIWNKVIEVLDQLVEILGDEKVTVKEYRDILESGFSEIEIGVIPSTVDQVLIGSIERSRSHNVKALFLIGVNDGCIPATKADEGLFHDYERNILKELGVELGQVSESSIYEEKFNIYTALTKSSDYLWVSYALADQEGKGLRPSILIDTFKRLFPHAKTISDITSSITQQLQLVTTPMSTFKHLIIHLRSYIDDKGMENLWWDVYNWYFTNAEWKEKRLQMIEGLFHNNQVHGIPPKKSKELYATNFNSSVSRLEKYSKCPFSYLIQYGLTPKERKIFEISNPDIGMIFHNTIEDFEKLMNEKKYNWREIDQDCCNGLVDEVIENLAEKFQKGILGSSYRYKYLLNRLKRISKRALWTLTTHLKKGNFSPYGHEIIFGRGGNLPPLVVELPSGQQLHLEGRIDRVDFLEDDENVYVKIIDYKSGDKDFSLSDLYYGLELQLMVYLDVVLSMTEYLKKDVIYPAGIFYFKIDDPLIRTNEKTAEVIEREINKELRMKGLALNDVRIIKEMDKDINGWSDVISVALNKGEEIGKNSSVLSAEEFQTLRSYVRQIIKDIATEILEGTTTIRPFKKGKTVACQYCSFISICQFDKTLEENRYRIIKNLNTEDVFSLISMGKEGK